MRDVYYNENDPTAVAWLGQLMDEGLIPKGVIDNRSITEVRPHEIARYHQQHFFAGIGGWALALRLAGWPDDRPVRTGSCPCQPFSDAGNGMEEADSRHLWPFFRDLITFGDAAESFGEQVASKAGRRWLARVRADLEGLGHAVGAADLCAASVGSPQIRQRLYWVAYSMRKRREARQRPQAKVPNPYGSRPELRGTLGGLGLPDGDRRKTGKSSAEANGHRGTPISDGSARRVAHLHGDGRKQEPHALWPRQPDLAGLGSWARFEVVQCADGKARRFEPGSFPLAHGVSGRVGLLRGYGNAIVPDLAVQFIQACLEVI